MKNRKILASFGVLAAGALLLSSCSSDAGSSSGDDQSGNAGQSGEWDNPGNLDIEAGQSKDPITLTAWFQDLGEDDPFTNPVAQRITEITGVTLEIQHPIGGDTQALALMLTGGDIPDILHLKGETGKFIEAEAIIPLDDYFASPLGENLTAFYGDYLDRLRNSTADPQIYHVGTGEVASVNLSPSGTMQLQLNALKEAGYPDVQTLDDYAQVIRDYLAASPQTEDGQDRIGMTLLTTNWRWMIDLGNPSGYAAGYHDDGQWIVDQDTFEATYKFHHPDVKAYFKWLNEMYAEGILDPASFTQTEDEYNAKVATGRVVGLATQNWAIDYGPAATLRGEGKAWDTYAWLPVTIEAGTLQPDTRTFGYTGTPGMTISATSDNKERAFAFLDWFATEEAQILNNWGIEGEHYTIVDGLRVQTDADRKASQEDSKYSLNSGVGAYTHPFPRAGAALDSNGQAIQRSGTREMVIQNLTLDRPAEVEVLAAYDAEVWADLFPAPEDFPPAKYGRVWEMVIPVDVQTTQEELDNQMPERLKGLVTGSTADFDAGWDKLQADLEAQGVDSLEETITELVKDRMVLWGTNS